MKGARREKMPCRSFVFTRYKKTDEQNAYRLYGADDQIRTGDLILTKDALYRLSYISICRREGRFNRKSGADDQIRTGDLILTKDALYRLSYISLSNTPR